MGQPATEPPVQPTTPPAGEPPATPPAPAAPESRGPAGGEKAILADLAKEREARKALEAKLAAMGAALGVEPDANTKKPDLDALAARIEAQERRAAEAELRAVRLEVAAEKGLTPAQAERLQGSTRDELTADADALKALFSSSTSGTPGTPAPDPSQGARGGSGSLDAEIAEAEAKGNHRLALALKVRKQAGS